MTHPLAEPATWIDRDTYAAYCGGSSRLLAHYDKAVEKGNPMQPSWNWLGVLLFPAWCGHRRQWGVWAAFVGLILVLGVFEAVTGILLPNAVFIGLGVGAGMLANGILLSRAITRHHRLVQAGLAPETVRDRLRGAASPSVAGAIAGLVGALVIVVAGYGLIDVTLGLPG